MKRAFYIIVLFALAALFAGCGPAGKVIHFVREPWAVESELEKQIGMKSNVSLNWDNMTFSKATVTFDTIPSTLTVSELASAVRGALRTEVHQQPEELVIEIKLRQ
jgi:hypothetical protein